MKAIELTAALIAANDVTITKVDALVETSVLKQLIESCKTRIDALDPEAKILAEKALSEIGENSGKFTHQGHHYTLDVVPVFDLIGDTKKYNTPEAATYRRKAREKDEHKKQSAKLTMEMKTILDAYPKDHPNIIPDDIMRKLKCID